MRTRKLTLLAITFSVIFAIHFLVVILQSSFIGLGIIVFLGLVAHKFSLSELLILNFIDTILTTLFNINQFVAYNELYYTLTGIGYMVILIAIFSYFLKITIEYGINIFIPKRIKNRLKIYQ